MRKLLDDGESLSLIAIAERSSLVDVGSLASTATDVNSILHPWLKRQQVALRSLASIMSDVHSLEELRSRCLLRLDSLQLGDEGMQTIAAAARAGSLPNLQELHCSYNDVSSGLACFAPNVSLRRLRELWLDNNKLTADNLITFCDQLTTDSLPTIQDFYLSNNLFGCKGLAALSSAFRRAVLPRSLLQLDLACCGIGDDGLAAFASAVAGSALPELEHLGLSRNLIGCTGLTSLTAAVARGALTALEQLELGSNRITNTGMQALASALAGGRWPKLEALLIYCNQIGDGGLEALTNALDAGCLKSLCFLTLDGNPASPAAHALANAALNSRKRCARRQCLEQAYERAQVYESEQATAHAGESAGASTRTRKEKESPLVLRGLLGDAEIAEIHAAATKLRRDTPLLPRSSSPSPPPSSTCLSHVHRYAPSHSKLFLHFNGYFQAECPRICNGLLAQMRSRCEVERTDRGQMRIRTIEYHTYSAGGSLLDPAHRDHGSDLSLSVLLSSHAEHSGGDFMTWSGGRAVVHPLVQGDGVLFRSELVHNVSAVTEGVRHALVIELWEAEGDNQADRYA